MDACAVAQLASITVPVEASRAHLRLLERMPARSAVLARAAAKIAQREFLDKAIGVDDYGSSHFICLLVFDALFRHARKPHGERLTPGWAIHKPAGRRLSMDTWRRTHSAAAD